MPKRKLSDKAKNILSRGLSAASLKELIGNIREHKSEVDNASTPLNTPVSVKTDKVPSGEARLDDGPLGYVPVIGDLLQAGQAAVDASEGRIGDAALGLTLLAAPNILAQPLKKGARRAASQVAEEAASKLSVKSEAPKEQVRALLERARSGIDAPLPTEAVDLFGTTVHIPEEFAAAMRSDRFKAAYPNGVDIWYRGLDPAEWSTTGNGWQTVKSGYPSLFGGDRKMASAYIGDGTSKVEGPGLLTLVTPKGMIVDAGDVGGSSWQYLTNRKPEVDAIDKELKSLYSKARNAYDAGDHTAYEKLWDEIDNIRKARRELIGIEVPGLTGKFNMTDQIASALRHERVPGGVLIRNVDDGPVADEVIWNYKFRGAPKAIHPDQTYMFDLYDGTFLSKGGGIHIKPENRGKFTALKKRTGHSATWFKQHGTPAQKKMATFALNAMHWNHKATGGPIDETDPAFVGPPVPAGIVPMDFQGIIDRQRYAESIYKDTAENKKTGAKGAYQIMDSTVGEYVDRTGDRGNVLNPNYNRRIRDWYINVRLPEFEMHRMGAPTDSVRVARRYAAYNEGPGSVRKAIKKAKSEGVDIDSSFAWLPYLTKDARNYVNFVVRNQDVPGTHMTKEQHEREKKKHGYADGGTIDRLLKYYKPEDILKAIKKKK